MDLEKKIIFMREQGTTLKTIADSLNVKYDKVRSVLKKNEVKITSFKFTCLKCEEVFISNKNHSKFCSDVCRGSYNRVNRGHKRKCCGCGKTYYKYKNTKFCSRECVKFESMKPKKPKEQKKIYKVNCSSCNKEFETTKTNKKYCSNDCSYANLLKTMEIKRQHERVFHQKKCKECGKHFSSSRSNATFCNELCGNKYENRRKETVRRKRIKENGKVDWNISIERLIKRDGPSCYLCGNNVIISSDTNDDFYPSIEHVVPIAKGGTHTWDNVRIAHRYCNTLKKDNELSEEPTQTVLPL